MWERERVIGNCCVDFLLLRDCPRSAIYITRVIVCWLCIWSCELWITWSIVICVWVVNFYVYGWMMVMVVMPLPAPDNLVPFFFISFFILGGAFIIHSHFFMKYSWILYFIIFYEKNISKYLNTIYSLLNLSFGINFFFVTQVDKWDDRGSNYDACIYNTLFYRLS
jgi:hypothetical protein